MTADLLKVEFHRNGYGMLPESGDKDPGMPICFPRAPESSVFTGLCDCRASRTTRACTHFSRLVRIVSEIRNSYGGRNWWDVFAQSLWCRIAQVISEGDATPCADVRVAKSRRASVFTSPRGTFLARILDPSAASFRFLERLRKAPQGMSCADRAELLQRIADLQRTEEERMINGAGLLTRRQAAEQSFWGRLAYHCHREYQDAAFRPAIDEGSGDFMLRCFAHEKEPALELAVPRRQVRRILALLASEFPEQPGMAIHPVPLRPVLFLAATAKPDFEVRPAVRFREASGEAGCLQAPDFDKFCYGDLVYLPEIKTLAALEASATGRSLTASDSMRIEKSRLPAFLDEHRKEIEEGLLVLDEPLRHLSVLREYDRLEILPDALERSWYWLSVRYGFGRESVSLADVMEARRQGQPYLETERGWIDVRSAAFRALDSIERRGSLSFRGERVGLSAVELLRLMALNERPLQLEQKSSRAEIFRRLLALSPSKPLGALKGMVTPLRPYQARGVDWLRFLFENGLAGLLCDDMGLGKTHQAMALMTWIRERRRGKEPFLVICPTTVISHWLQKIGEHAPALKAVVYHGGQRDLDAALKRAKVLVTSYGILRNDVARLSQVPFTLIIFDEVQNLKNRETQSYQAASSLRARMRIGLTGTPIENSIADLKSLFDLILPGYLGSDDEFTARYMDSRGDGTSGAATGELKRQIAPFVLRRLKSAVLDELPEKIEDRRTCRLSEMQVRLYRDALATRGTPLLRQLESGEKQLPYIHIFALLNLLKRICDHPALALNRVDKFREYESGKWELFQELLSESLDSGHKVIVFSQYLGMIRMMESLLKSLAIGSVTLTGASQERGEIVRRFNQEPECRVFLGSLKAGGAGIDLVGGSVVIHYDRWWNAAREDQATDRAHRIGQKQAVQVFKLIAEGTLEEKISAIIERKRRLMDSVVAADDPGLNKVFTRDELIELLRPI